MTDKILRDIADMTVAIENGDKLTYQEIYVMLMRAYVEIMTLNNKLRFLEGKQP